MNDTTKLKYLRMLSHTDVEQQRTAILELGKLDDPYIFKILASHFFDAQPALRDALFQVFTRHQKRWIAEIVADTLLSPQLAVRSLATDILKAYRAEAIWPLKRLMKSPTAEVRKSAAEILGNIPDPRAAEILYNHLDDENENVVIAVIEGLGQQKEIRAVPVLIKLLQEENPYHPMVINALLSTLSFWQNKLFSTDFLHEDEFMHYATLDAVRQNGNGAGLEKVIEMMLEYDDENFLFEAVETLNVILDVHPNIVLPGKLFPVFENLHRNKNLEIHFKAFLNCLSRIGSRRSLNLLLNCLKNDKMVADTLSALAQFAANFPDVFFDYYALIPKSIRTSLLEGMVGDGCRIELDGESLRETLDQCLDCRERVWLLRLFADAQNEELVKLADNELRNDALDEVAKFELAAAFEHAAFLPIYYQALTTENPAVQQKALKTLIKLDSKAAEYLIRKSQDEPHEMWPALISAVGAFPLRHIEKFWKAFWEDKSEEKVQLITAYINQPGARRAVPAILKAVMSDQQLFGRIGDALVGSGFQWEASPEIFQWLEMMTVKERKKFETILNRSGLQLPRSSSREEMNSSISVTEEEKQHSAGSWN